MLQKRSLIVIIFLSLYLTSRMIVKVFRRTVCPQIRVGSCFRSMTLVVNDAMVAIGKKNKLISGGNSRIKRTGLLLLSLMDLQSPFWYIFCATGPKNIYDNRYLTVA